MPIINCPECTAEISDTTFDCPKCGAILRKPKRTFFGKIVKWGFILFNIIMMLWLFGGVSGGSDAINSASSDAEAAGVAIGTALGAGMLIAVWGFGDVVLGMFFMFTRPSK